MGAGRGYTLGAVVIGLALATAACGGPSKAGVASLATTTTASRPATAGSVSPSPDGERAHALVEFARCLRVHGVLNFPDPRGPANVMKAFKESGGMSTPAFQTAARACAKYSPPDNPPPQITTEDQADYLKAATCMRDHGIVGFPDPVFASGQVNFPIPAGMNTEPSEFLRAREVCEMLIPVGLPYSKEAENGQ